MFIVLIQWRIKPTEEHLNAFHQYWRNDASINDDNGLIGEYLSKPILAEEVEYPIDEVFPDDDQPCVVFVNVGIWRDKDAFYSQIGKNIPARGVMKDFEQYPRRRIPLEPKFWRRGKSQLPDENNL